MPPAVVPIGSTAEFDQFLSQGQSPVVALFYATWHEPCKQMLSLAGQLSEDYPSVAFVTIDADQVPELAKRFRVNSAPTTLVLQSGAEVERIESADVKSVANAVRKVAAESGENLRDPNLDLRRIVNQRPIMLFMKGSPDQPKCGFSAKIVALLKSKNVEFGHFDILTDETVRQGLKTFANWKTYPQLWIKGEFVGGLDIVTELDEAEELDDMLQNAAGRTQQSLEDRLRSLIASSPVMVFMKGSPEAPQCGFSRKLVEILKTHRVDFGSFNILEDNEVREGLKKFSQWPTYPQVYVRGELVGGLDIIIELDEAGELDDALAF